MEPLTTTALLAAKELAKQAIETTAAGKECLSPVLNSASSEARSAVECQLRVRENGQPTAELFTDCGRSPTRIEGLAQEEIQRTVDGGTIEGKRLGLVGEKVREQVAFRAEQQGKICNIEREPVFGDRRLDLRYQAARDIVLRDQLTGVSKVVEEGRWIAEEVKNRTVDSLKVDARGRLVDQISSAMRGDHDVLLTVRKEILSTTEGRQVLESLRENLATTMNESGKRLFIKGRDLGATSWKNA